MLRKKIKKDDKGLLSKQVEELRAVMGEFLKNDYPRLQAQIEILNGNVGTLFQNQDLHQKQIDLIGKYVDDLNGNRSMEDIKVGHVGKSQRDKKRLASKEVRKKKASKNR